MEAEKATSDESMNNCGRGGMIVAVVDDGKLAKKVWRGDGRGLLRNLVVLLAG